jgi:succinoglycan biosynthesis protein ExoA
MIMRGSWFARNSQVLGNQMAVQVSVIVPIRNEENFIERTLRALQQQDFPFESAEILVVDGESTDKTPEIVAGIAARDSRVRLLSNPRRWSSAARALGVREARGEYLLIVDGHCELQDPDYFQKLVQAFETSGADCLGRPQPQDVSHATPIQQAIAAARSSPVGHHPDSFIYSDQPQFVPAHSVAVAYRRSLFEQVGNFDDSFDACEDVELNHRIDQAGLRCWFAPELQIRYEPRGTLAGLFRQLVRYGRGRIRLMRKHPDTRSLKTLIPALFVAGLPVGLVAGLFSSWLAIIYVAVLLLYLAIILIGSLGVVGQVGSWQAAAWIPLVLIVVHLASGWGQWREWFQPVRANPFAQRR